VTTMKPPDDPRAADTLPNRVSGRTTDTSETSALMRHLLVDIPESDQQHLVDIVDRNHAAQLARKRRAPAELGLDSAAKQDADVEDDD
jgi:hypothetical protein